MLLLPIMDLNVRFGEEFIGKSALYPTVDSSQSAKPNANGHDGNIKRKEVDNP